MKTLWNIICQEAPDMAGGAPAPADAPAGADDAAAAAAAATQNNPLAGDPPAPAPAKRAAPDWAFKRISEESAKAQQALERAQDAERRAQAAEALAARLQSGQASLQTTQQPSPQNSQIDPALIRAEAERIRFGEDVSDIRSRGFAEFGQSFNDTIAALGALNAATPEFISDVLAVDKANAHKILREIAEDGERAVSLANMTPRQRVAELTRMTIKANEPAPAKASEPPARHVSKAPAPPPPVTPSTTKTLAPYSDEMSDEDFTRQFNERQAARRAKR